MTQRGRFIALEGIDGSGKTTQARSLAGALGALLTAEPGATSLGARLRGLVLDPDAPPVSPRAEALLMAADRSQHVAELIVPTLDAGRWVVCDRYSGSTLAYQGFGQGLDVNELRGLVDWATAGLQPDLTVLVDVPVDVARRRRDRAVEDRLEQLGEVFQARVRTGYLALAGSEPGAWVVVDGARAVPEVTRDVLDVVTARLAPLPAAAP